MESFFGSIRLSSVSHGMAEENGIRLIAGRKRCNEEIHE
jgi:hypothetical protein